MLQQISFQRFNYIYILYQYQHFILTFMIDLVFNFQFIYMQSTDQRQQLLLQSSKKETEEINIIEQNDLMNFNYMSLLKSPKKLSEVLKSILTNALSKQHSQNHEEALKLYSKCIEILEIFNKMQNSQNSQKGIFLSGSQNSNNNYQKYMRLIIYGNAASCSQNCWKIQKCNGLCYQLQNEFENVIKKSSNRQVKLNLNRLFIRIKYQHCALLSQLNLHEKALQTCKESLPILKQNIQIILDYLSFKMKTQESNNSINLHKNGQSMQEGIIFKKKICNFAQPILQNLLNLINSLEASTKKLLQSYDNQYNSSNGVTTNSSNVFDLYNSGNQISKSKKFYYWEKNPQKNADQLNKVFLSPNGLNETNLQNAKRSILGVNKSKSWIDQFNIGSVMRMQFYQFKDFQKSLPIEQYIFRDKIFQLVIYCSIGFFSIATELRFLDTQNKEKQNQQSFSSIASQSNLKQKEKQFHQKPSSPVFLKLKQIKKKYGYNTEKNSFKKLSQYYHSQSIYIITQNIKTKIPYLQHIIKSYEKHYIIQKKLQEIQSIAQESGISSFIQPNAQMKQMKGSSLQYSNSNKKQKGNAFNKLQNESRKSLQYGLELYENSNKKLNKINQLLIQSSESLKRLAQQQNIYNQKNINSLTPNSHQYLKFQIKKNKTKSKRDNKDRHSLKSNEGNNRYSDFQSKNMITLGNSLQEVLQQKKKIQKIYSPNTHRNLPYQKKQKGNTFNLKSKSQKQLKDLKISNTNNINENFDKNIQVKKSQNKKLTSIKSKNKLKFSSNTNTNTTNTNNPLIYQSPSQKNIHHLHLADSKSTNKFSNFNTNTNKEFKKTMKQPQKDKDKAKRTKISYTPNIHNIHNDTQYTQNTQNTQNTHNTHNINENQNGLFSKPELHIKHKSVTQFKFVFNNQ